MFHLPILRTPQGTLPTEGGVMYEFVVRVFVLFLCCVLVYALFKPGGRK